MGLFQMPLTTSQMCYHRLLPGQYAWVDESCNGKGSPNGLVPLILAVIGVEGHVRRVYWVAVSTEPPPEREEPGIVAPASTTPSVPAPPVLPSKPR